MDDLLRPRTLEELAKNRNGDPLVCTGCAHSASCAPFPGAPSGERPCCFCVRNVNREAEAAEHFKTCQGTQNVDGKIVDCVHPAHGRWYDGSKAMKVPMDCYRSTDMLKQAHLWDGGSENDVLMG